MLGHPVSSGGVRVTLGSSNKVATPPQFVLVPGGQTSATFSVRTVATQTSSSATIAATLGNAAVTAVLDVNPPGIKSLTLNPPTVPGGTPSTGTVVLGAEAPIGGTTVSLAVDNTNVASVVWGLLIPAGQTTGQ